MATKTAFILASALLIAIFTSAYAYINVHSPIQHQRRWAFSLAISSKLKSSETILSMSDPAETENEKKKNEDLYIDEVRFITRLNDLKNYYYRNLSFIKYFVFSKK